MPGARSEQIERLKFICFAMNLAYQSLEKISWPVAIEVITINVPSLLKGSAREWRFDDVKRSLVYPFETVRVNLFNPSLLTDYRALFA